MCTESSTGVRAWAAFAAAGVYGAVLWGTSPVWSGAKEPWDAAMAVYMLLLTLGGLLAAICPRRALVAPAGLVIGQVAWQVSTGAGSLWPLAMMVLSVLAVPAAGVAGIVWFIDWRRRVRADREAAGPSVAAAWPTHSTRPPTSPSLPFSN